MSSLPDFDVPHRFLLDFLSQEDGTVHERYERFRDEQLESAEEISHTTLDKREGSELFEVIFQAELLTHQAGSVDPSKVAPKSFWAFGLGFYLSVMAESDIVGPDGEATGSGLADVYARQLLNNPDNFYDIYYELEVAAMLKKDHDEVYLIDDFGSDRTSADVLYIEEGNDYWIECKNKKGHTKYGSNLEWFGRSIADKLFTEQGLDIGDDSFGVRVSSEDDLPSRFAKEEDIKQNLSSTLARGVYEAITGDENILSLTFSGVTFDIELKGYHHGRREVYLSDRKMEQVAKRVNMFEIFDPLRHVNVRPNILTSNGHANIYAEKVGDNRIEIFSSYAFEFDIPWSVDYVSWLHQTASDVSGQHDRYDNLIAFIGAPVGVFVHMNNNEVENHKGEVVTEYERLREKIGGIFAHPDRDNSFMAVVLSTHYMVDERTDEGRNVRMWVAFDMIQNENVKREIPNAVKSLVDEERKIKDVVLGGGSARMVY